jgi:predicted ATPase
MTKLSFTEEVIQNLFGHEAAEDEDPARLRQYYFKSSTYDQVVTTLPLRIVVGHKGIGKSALFREAMAELRDASKLAIEIKPDDVADIARGQPDFLSSISRVENWPA